MSYKTDYSYRRYANYRASRHQYKTNQIAAPIVMILIIGFFSKYWFPILLIGSGLVALLIYRRNCSTDGKKELGTEVDIKAEKTIERRKAMDLKSTDAGYVNKKNQKNLGKTTKPGTDNNQWFYEMECLDCGHKYYANGSDVWQRKCPKCQGGQP